MARKIHKCTNNLYGGDNDSTTATTTSVLSEVVVGFAEKFGLVKSSSIIFNDSLIEFVRPTLIYSNVVVTANMPDDEVDGNDAVFPCHLYSYIYIYI